MNFVEERIIAEGKVCDGDILKIDSFLNHQIDTKFVNEIGKEFANYFKDKMPSKILTIESSGIAVAQATSIAMNYLPVVFAKKAKSINIDGDVYVAEVESFTHKNKNQVIVSKSFLGPDDHVLIIDDFLANGCALQGLISIVGQYGKGLMFS